MSTKVRSIAYKVKLRGNGGVNFDKADSQVSMFVRQNKYSVAGSDVKFSNDNIKLHKGNYYKVAGSMDDKGILREWFVKKQKISSGCLRQAIFQTAQPIYNSGIAKDPRFVKFIASPSAVLRGYMYATSNSIKRKSPVLITSAEQTNNVESCLELSTSRDVSARVKTNGEAVDNEKSKLSLFSVESLGHIEYEAEGFLDLGELRFICFDDRYLRPAVPVTSEEKAEYIKSIETNFGPGAVVGHFEKAGCEINSMEEGLYLSSDQVNKLVRYYFEKLLGTMIVRTSGYAEVVEVSYKFIYEDDLSSKMSDNDASKYTVLEDPKSISFDTADSYLFVKENDAKVWSEEQDKVKELQVEEEAASKKKKLKEKDKKKDKEESA